MLLWVDLRLHDTIILHPARSYRHLIELAWSPFAKGGHQQQIPSNVLPRTRGGHVISVLAAVLASKSVWRVWQTTRMLVHSGKS